MLKLNKTGKLQSANFAGVRGVSPSVLKEYRNLVRQDLCAFIEGSFRELNPQTEFLSNWHIRVMAHELEKCRRGETKRLIINITPRSMRPKARDQHQGSCAGEKDL